LSLAHNAEVKVFSGAAQSVAKIWLLAATELSAGGAGWAQLQLNMPMALAAGDRFILRQPSPSLTLGGGAVVDAHPARRYRRRAGSADSSVLDRLDALSRGTPAQRLVNALRAEPFLDRAAAMAAAQVAAGEIDGALAALTESGELIAMRDVLGLTLDWRAQLERAAGMLGAFHASQTLALGMPRDTLRSRLGLDARVFNAMLQVAVADAPRLVDDGETVRLASHAVVFNPAQQRAVDSLLAQCQAQPYNTPSVKDARAAAGDPVYDVLIRTRQLVQCGPDVIFTAGAYDAAVSAIRELIARDGQVTAAQVRDAFSTTRKYALGLLEHLDAIGVTKRVGDARVLKR
jgi:selenocysteine-specific elongation factor